MSPESHSEERQRGVKLFNGTWELIGSREDDDRMLHMAHASRYHWGEAPECRPENLARGEWLISRVYCVLGRAEPALWHGRRAWSGSRRRESATGTSRTRTRRSRASAVAGDAAAAGEWRARARQAGDAIGDPEDREHFDEDFATL